MTTVTRQQEAKDDIFDRLKECQVQLQGGDLDGAVVVSWVSGENAPKVAIYMTLETVPLDHVLDVLTGICKNIRDAIDQSKGASTVN